MHAEEQKEEAEKKLKEKEAPHEEKKTHEKKKPHEEKKGPEIGPAHDKEEKLPGPLGEKPEPPTPPLEAEHLVAPPEAKKTEITPPDAEKIIPEIQQNNQDVRETKEEEITGATEEITVGTNEDAAAGVTVGQSVAEYALRFVGNPYKWGGASLTNGADCSGFVQSVYAHFDYTLSRTSKEQANTAGYMKVAAKESELMPGDLVFYANNRGVVFHVAIYIGDGKVVHAANSQKGIIVSEYTYMKPYKARRVIK